MQRNKTFKPCSIPWVPELPIHWKEEKGKWVHRFLKEMNYRKQCANVLSLTLRGVVNNDPDDPEGMVPKDYRTYQIFEKGDLVFKLIDLESHRTSRVGLVHERGIMSPAYLRIRLGRSQNPQYHYYYYYSMYQQGIYNKLGAGVRSTLGATDLLELGIPLPPPAEQDRIVTLLDQKIAEINAAIIKKKQLIQLLEESKRSLIYHAVTAGVSGNVPMCPTGLAWFPLAPVHWKLKRLKTISSFITSGPRGWSNLLSDEGAVFLQSGNLNNSLGIDMEGAHRVVVPNGAEAKRTLIHDGDVLICITGANTGRIAVANTGKQEAYINQHLSLVRINDANPKFVAYSLSAQGSEYFLLCQYGLKEGLSLFNVANAPIFLPSLNEQNDIVAFLDKAVSKIDMAMLASRKQCNQLEELKKTIIAEAVTGRLL